MSELADDQEQEKTNTEQETLDAMLDTIRQAKVAPLILSSVSTFASVAYGKLEMGELSEAKIAINAIDVLLPLLQDEVDDEHPPRLRAGADEPQARLRRRRRVCRVESRPRRTESALFVLACNSA